METENLDALAAQAETIDAAPEPEAAQDAAGAVVHDVGAEVAALLQTVAGILTPAFPSLGEIYKPETCAALGQAAAPVLDKYGLSVGGIFDKYGPEITLAAVAFPVAVATWQGIKKDRAESKKPAAPGAAEPAPAAPGAVESQPAPAANSAPLLVIPGPRQ